MAGNLSFEDLIRRVRAGDDEAATLLVRQYEPAIRRAARIRLRDAHLQRTLDSVDICQMVLASFFVSAALGRYELGQPQELVNLLATMVHHKVVDERRHEQAERRDQRRNEPGAALEHEPVSPDLTPSQEVAGRELLDEFRKRLSAEERHLAEERLQGRPWADIAVELGRSPEALRKQLTRGVQRVARELGLEVPA
jgi:RNA polymerase sigma factor (sigma-70 family)